MITYSSSINSFHKLFLAFLLSFLFLFADVRSQSIKDHELTIDETENTITVEQIIKIDSVWAGHPVGFSLYTHGKRQYIAYYNANRNMVVGLFS